MGYSAGVVVDTRRNLGAALQADGETRSPRSPRIRDLRHQKEKRSMEHFAGLDVSVKETSVCIVDEAGRITREVKVASTPEALMQVLRAASLVNPADRNLAQIQSREVLSAAGERGLELHILNVRSEGEFDAVFADIKRLQVGGLVIGAGPVFLRGLDKLAALTVRNAVPAIYSYRNFPAAGGLMSYGTD